MNKEPTDSGSEIDRLKYEGNSIPFFIKFVWLAIAIYTVAYLALYAWPDLLIWLKK